MQSQSPGRSGTVGISLDDLVDLCKEFGFDVDGFRGGENDCPAR